MLNSSKNTIGARIFPVIPSPTAIPAAITQNQTILLNLAFQSLSTDFLFTSVTDSSTSAADILRLLRSISEGSPLLSVLFSARPALWW